MSPLSPVSTQAIARLRAYVPPPTIYSSLPLSRRAAVLILLFADRSGDLRVVLTPLLRAIAELTLSRDAGQVALPGGKADFLEEKPFQTARREASEEIGLPSDDRKLPPPFQAEHLCELPANLALTQLGVRPCVALLHTGNEASGSSADPEETLIPRLDAREVADVFSAPFHGFLSDREESEDGDAVASSWYKGSWTTSHGTKWRMHSFHVPNTRGADSPSMNRYRVFGLTARILVDAARVAYAEEPTFEHNSSIGEEELIRGLFDAGKMDDIRKPGHLFPPSVLGKPINKI